MQIRPVKRNEYGQLLGLMRQLNPLDPAASAIELQVFKEIINSKYLNLIVAEDEGFLLGSCYINVIPNITRGGRPYAVIENVVTDATHRNQGIGKSLLDHAVKLAWEQNCYKVMLMSGRKEKSVHAFYQKCGFNADEKQAYIQRAPCHQV
jgi:GNAT superfamily N-acetyltransferase